MDRELKVEDALAEVRYRVYPDTPMGEVLDLMVRRRIHAVPVVGESYEVLGIITSGDALAHMTGSVRGSSDEAAGEGAVARDVMTRTVLCVSEDQLLTEAAQMMVNRDVEQLPVVRDSELIGFLTRDALLRALHGDPGAKEDDDSGPSAEEDEDS
jgi:CBS domain-containing protein